MSLALVVATLVPEAPDAVPSRAPEGADVLEVRLDGLDPDDVAPAVDAHGGPVLATCRREADGGVQALAEPERRRRLETALDAGAELADLEPDAPFFADLAARARREGVTVVASEHALEATPTPETILDRLEELGRLGDVAKLATAADDADDVARLVEAAIEAPTLGTPFALMGVGDPLLRGLAGPLGQALVYAAPGEAAVPGQLPAALQGRLPRHPPSPEPRRDYALLGHPVGHSLSPPMQEAAFARLGIPARYRLVDVPPGDLEAVLEGLAVAADGANVTAPHKIAVHDRADERTGEARSVGAANTLRFEDGEVRAHMTDGLGALDALRAREEAVEGRPVLVLGAGGTGRAVAHALADAGAEVTLANRTRKRAETLADEVGAEVVDLAPEALAGALPPGGLVLNATPVDPPVPDGALAEASAFDANYGDRAAFARRAREAGANVLDGLDLLVGQGLRSLAFWTDAEPGDEVRGAMRAAAETRALERRHRGGKA